VNILIDEWDFAKIGDLGTGGTLTSGAGTCHYMAPEMYDNIPDIFPFALILYELLIGEAVFPATCQMQQ
jgi:serine/threonine protein kinase